MNQNPQEVEELVYEIFVLRRMIEQLPPPLWKLFSTQLIKIIDALNKRDRTFKDKILTHVEDAILEIKAQEFDLQVTRKERDELKQ